MFSSMSGYAALTRLTGLCEGVKSLIAVKVAQPGEPPKENDIADSASGCPAVQAG